jgi:hypothetical protein
MMVTDVIPVQMVFVRWGNERGQAEESLGIVVSGRVYVPPNYAAWTHAFRPLADALSKQALQKLAEKVLIDAAPPPPPDMVDVTEPGEKKASKKEKK